MKKIEGKQLLSIDFTRVIAVLIVILLSRVSSVRIAPGAPYNSILHEDGHYINRLSWSRNGHNNML
jgi:hypothetical protein